MCININFHGNVESWIITGTETNWFSIVVDVHSVELLGSLHEGVGAIVVDDHTRCWIVNRVAIVVVLLQLLREWVYLWSVPRKIFLWCICRFVVFLIWMISVRSCGGWLDRVFCVVCEVDCQLCRFYRSFNCLLVFLSVPLRSFELWVTSNLLELQVTSNILYSEERKGYISLHPYICWPSYMYVGIDMWDTSWDILCWEGVEMSHDLVVRWFFYKTDQNTILR